MIHYEQKGWEFAPGTRERAIAEAVREIPVGGISRALDAMFLALKYGRTDHLCICGHYHP
jgi:hypothetical protein